MSKTKHEINSFIKRQREQAIDSRLRKYRLMSVEVLNYSPKLRSKLSPYRKLYEVYTVSYYEQNFCLAGHVDS